MISRPLLPINDSHFFHKLEDQGEVSSLSRVARHSSMTLGVKERKELVSVTMERLTSVIGASGKAEELVRLTTQIVQAAKRLAEDTPEPTKTRSTGVLAEFVIAAKKIAQNVRAVDSTSLQQLSSTRKAVESLVKELDGWHEAQISKHQPQAVSQEPSLEEILAQTNSISRQESRSSFASGKGSPTESPVSEQEKRLGAELKRQLEVLQRKAEPQSNPEQHGNPEEILRTAVGGLTRSTKELIELSGPGASGQKAPSREALLEPTVLLAKMVSMLMDLVDSLFVSKFPMRSQVREKNKSCTTYYYKLEKIWLDVGRENGFLFPQPCRDDFLYNNVYSVHL